MNQFFKFIPGIRAIFRRRTGEKFHSDYVVPKVKQKHGEWSVQVWWGEERHVAVGWGHLWLLKVYLCLLHWFIKLGSPWICHILVDLPLYPFAASFWEITSFLSKMEKDVTQQGTQWLGLLLMRSLYYYLALLRVLALILLSTHGRLWKGRNGQQ